MRIQIHPTCKGLSMGVMCGKWFLLLLFDSPVCPRHMPQYVQVSFLGRSSSYFCSPFTSEEGMANGLVGESQSQQGASDGQKDTMTGVDEAFLHTLWETAEA